MDNIGIVVDDLGGTIDFFRELGLELEGRATIEGENRTRNETSSSLRTESERSIEGSWPQSSLNCSGCRRQSSNMQTGRIPSFGIGSPFAFVQRASRVAKDVRRCDGLIMLTLGWATTL